MDLLTPRQKQILTFISEEVMAKGYPPSVREIGEAVGLKSSSTVHAHLRKLEEKGYIKRDPTKPRAIELIHDDQVPRKSMVNVPMIGRVTAGAPILAVENVEDHFPIPKDFVNGYGEDLFMLRISGDSMIDAGILNDDYVIVRRQSHATNGDIVVALIEDEATVKRFYREFDHVRLQPENSAMTALRVTNVSILGKVIGVFRRM